MLNSEVKSKRDSVSFTNKLLSKKNELLDCWRITELGEVSKIDWGNTSITKKSYVEKGYPAFSASGQDGFLKKYEFEDDAIILSAIGARCGKCFLAKGKWNAIKNTIIIRPIANIHTSFLFYQINRESFWMKSGAGQPFITLKSARKQKIKLPFKNGKPNLKIQKEIVEILEKAEKAKDMRKEADELTKYFLKSVFLEMFGDPVNNVKGWKIMSLDDVCEIIYRYPTFYGFKYSVKGIPVVKIGNIDDDGKLNEDLIHYNFITSEINERYPKTILKFQDTLMAVRGDGSTGKIGYVQTKLLEGANISPNLLRFSANKNIVNPMYLFYILSSDFGQAIIASKITRTAKKTITAGDIKKIGIPTPPMHLQNKFASMVNEIEKMKEYQKQLKKQIHNLFDNLMQKAFKGELVC